MRTDAYRERGEHVYYRDTSAALTRLKQMEDYGWLNEVSSVPTQQALRHLDRAFRNFFDGRAKYPKFKKKRGRQSAEYTHLGLQLGWQRLDAGVHAGSAAHSLEPSPAQERQAQHHHGQP